MATEQAACFHVGTDVGGTFTDLWVADGQHRPRVFKSPTTADIVTGILDALHLAASSYGLSFADFCARILRFGHGTTVGLNALLTGRAARTAILTTAGFGDTLEIGRMKRSTAGLSEFELTDFFRHGRFAPLVPRHRVIEITERIDRNGRVVTQLNEASARAAIAGLRGQDIAAIAICTLWATANPAHERKLAAWTRDILGDVFICLSHEISPVVGEYGRMSTTAANAALGPVAGRYLARLQALLHEAGMAVPVLMMTNAGGVLPTDVLTDRPAFTLFSGPAAGVVGSLEIGRQLQEPNLLTTDIGGTSYDVGVIVDGKPVMRREISVAGADLRVPSIDVASIGAGGGSIASVAFGQLQVGPQSAGAQPGPACYGRGGTLPTATDADLVLGVLAAENFIGGRMTLNIEAARRAIQDHVATPLGIDVIAAAWGIREVLDARMADLLRRATIERGHDPREFVLLANGGAGPSHAWALVRDLGLRKFVVPAAATAQSAFGCGNSSLGVTQEAPVYLRAGAALPVAAMLEEADAVLRQLEADVRAGLVQAGVADGVAITRVLSLRYRGQTNTLDIAIEAGVFDGAAYQNAIARFEHVYETQFGRGAGYRHAGFEILAARVAGQAALPAPASITSGGALVAAGFRPIVFDPRIGAVPTAIWRTDFPPPGCAVAGPAVIEFPGQSVVVPPGGTARADDFGNLHVEIAT